MKVIQDSISVNTSDSMDIVNVAGQITTWLQEIGARNGTLTVFCRHTTAGLTINEAESGLLQDIVSRLSKLVPPGAGYQHNRVDSNAHSHIMTSLVGSSQSIPVEDGRLSLGTWQKPLLVECDGPRSRTLSLTFMGTCQDEN
ncbi:YjbQ family protein [Candidatus Thorarchaeota archaeon]|nr:MAG: YjbQ family protein [Candidatus Thorarchaeota archaeon]